MRSIASLFVLSALVLAGCAGEPSRTAGTHLVYRDDSGKPTMQFDYPTEDFCRKVEAIAGGNAHCQPDSAGAQLPAHATLRYEPPGLLVEGHYPDLARCQTANSRTAPGVRVLNPCAAL